MSFAARYRGATLRAFTQHLRHFLRWCAKRAVEPLLAQRPHLELDLRWMQQHRLAPATINRRFTPVAGLYCYAVIDGHCQKDPSVAVTRPRAPRQGQHRTVLYPVDCTRWSTQRTFWLFAMACAAPRHLEARPGRPEGRRRSRAERALVHGR